MSCRSFFHSVSILVLLLLWKPIEAATYSTSTNQTSTVSQNNTSSSIFSSQTTTSGISFSSSIVFNPSSPGVQTISSAPSPRNSTNPSPTHSGFSNTTISQTAAWYTLKSSPTSTGTDGTPTPEPAILVPATPPELNPHDPVVLQPNASVSLFYQQPSQLNASNIAVASVAIPKLAYPAIVLDHSALVTHVECDTTILRIKFLHHDALDVAKNSWTDPKFVMMTFHDSCGKASETGERDYLLVHGLQFDHIALSVAADISHIGIADAVGHDNPITVDMGSYAPGSLNGSVGFDSANAPPVPSNGTWLNSTANGTTPSEDFDVTLDNLIGYTVLPASNVTQFPGLSPRARLAIRSWCGFCDKIVHAAKKVVQKFIPSWTLTPLNQNLNVNLGGGNVNTPWGKKGYQLYSTSSGPNFLRLYCVDCGVTGVVNVKATVTFNILAIISSGSLSANGWLGAGLGLGADANYVGSIPAFQKNIAEIPLSPFAIPGLITIGPRLDLGVGANAGVSANGQIYAGVRLNWPAIHAQLNLFGAPSASGWTPTVTTDFQAQGKLSLNADAYITVSIGFGISILNGLKSYGVSLVEKPDLYVTGTTADVSCHGIEIAAGFRNYVYADVLGTNHAINTWNGPSTQHCVRINKRDNLLTLPGPSELRRKRRPLRLRAATKQIQTSDNSVGIHYADNGNLYLIAQTNDSSVDMSTVDFATTNNSIITGGATARIFHGYEDSLSTVGVSRFRLSPPSHIPKTATPLTLQSSDVSDNHGVLVAVDASHNVYYPIACTFGDQDFPRLFLAKDLQAGVNTLLSDASVDRITGVKAADCDFIPLVAV